MKCEHFSAAALLLFLYCSSASAIDQTLADCLRDYKQQNLGAEVCTVINHHEASAGSDDTLGIATTGQLHLVKDFNEATLEGFGMSRLRDLIRYHDDYSHRIEAFTPENLFSKISDMARIDKETVKLQLKYRDFQLNNMLAKHWTVVKRVQKPKEITTDYLNHRALSHTMTRVLQSTTWRNHPKYLTWTHDCSDSATLSFSCPFTGETKDYSTAAGYMADDPTRTAEEEAAHWWQKFSKEHLFKQKVSTVNEPLLKGPK